MIRSKAFSLVELVIVIVIIGVIAAIAIPRMASGAARAKEAALEQNLTILRKAIDNYANEHTGAFPGSTADGAGGDADSAAAFISQLTMYSDEKGETSDKQNHKFTFGPYLRAIPGAPVGAHTGSSSVAIDTGNARPIVTGGNEGWVYNPHTGEIIVNTDDANESGTHAFDEY